MVKTCIGKRYSNSNHRSSSARRPRLAPTPCTHMFRHSQYLRPNNAHAHVAYYFSPTFLRGDSPPRFRPLAQSERPRGLLRVHSFSAPTTREQPTATCLCTTLYAQFLPGRVKASLQGWCPKRRWSFWSRITNLKSSRDEFQIHRHRTMVEWDAVGKSPRKSSVPAPYTLRVTRLVLLCIPHRLLRHPRHSPRRIVHTRTIKETRYSV